jgi:hypothetical protein
MATSIYSQGFFICLKNLSHKKQIFVKFNTVKNLIPRPKIVQNMVHAYTIQTCFGFFLGWHSGKRASVRPGHSIDGSRRWLNYPFLSAREFLKQKKESIFLPRGPPSLTRRTLHAALSAVPSPAAPPATSTPAPPHHLLAAPTRHCTAGCPSSEIHLSSPWTRCGHHLLDSSPRAVTSGEHRPTSLHSPKQQGDVALKAHVMGVHFKCLRSFRGMLQVFHTNVAKVDQDVTYVASCAHMLQGSVLNVLSVFFEMYVTSVFI